MDFGLVVRGAAVGLAALAIVAAAYALRDPPSPPSDPVWERHSVADPLRARLRLCQARGEAAADDLACLSAWAEARRQFLGAATDAGGGH